MSGASGMSGTGGADDSRDGSGTHCADDAEGSDGPVIPQRSTDPSPGALTWRPRPETSEDVPAVRRIHLAAFEGAEEADLVDALRHDRAAWLPGLSFVAAAPDGTPVAHALLTRCHVDDAPAVALAPCGVLPPYQRSGAGGAVIRALLEAARAAGERTAIVLGHPPYYPRFGFVPAATRFGILPPQPWPDEAFLALSLDGSTPPRGTVRYATAFGIS
ncbi:GNAT family N-acetyltransferase [Streptomyces sp. NPDC017993]|uniref:GNAT family N-acetyltransferase n=1 Tax=Streptomyces sp. NPDC017993 TaxID=3365027 RepID=UPI0037A2D89B